MGNRFLFILKTQQLSKDRLLYLPNLYTPVQVVSLRYQDTIKKYMFTLVTMGNRVIFIKAGFH